jgi:hypothetical protein
MMGSVIDVGGEQGGNRAACGDPTPNAAHGTPVLTPCHHRFVTHERDVIPIGTRSLERTAALGLRVDQLAKRKGRRRASRMLCKEVGRSIPLVALARPM